MRRIPTWLLLSVTLIWAAGGAGASLVETFDEDNADYQAYWIKNNGQLKSEGMVHHSGGYVDASLKNGGSRLYAIEAASNELFGDLSGLMLTVDYKLDGEVTGPDGAMVRFYVGHSSGGNNYFVTNDSYSWNPNTGDGWTTHTVALLAENFVRWPNQDANNKTFDQVVASVEDIGLVFTGSRFDRNKTLGFSGSQAAKLGIDNFGAMDPSGDSPQVPEPTTVALLSLGALAFVPTRKLKN